MTLPLSRRTFLCRSAAAGAFAVSPWFFTPNSAVAQEEEFFEIAANIGAGLAKSALGSAASMAFGHIMEAIGVDVGGQPAMEKKLDEILAKLDTLQKSVDSLTKFLEHELSQMKYDQSYAAVGRLIGTNKKLYDLFNVLLGTDAKAHPDRVIDLKRRIMALVEDNDYQIGVQTWHDALVGENGQSSLLQSWGSAVFRQEDVVFFDSSRAKIVQERWDSFDAQQAITVWCLIEGYNGAPVPQPDLAQSTLRTWWANRQTQLKVLRGCVRTVDEFPEAVNGKQTKVTTKLNCLPPYTIYSKANQKLWMLIPYGPVSTTINSVQYETQILYWTRSDANKTGVGNTMLEQGYWRLASDDDFVKLGRECGGTLGPGSNRDHFANALKDHGFLIDDPASFKIAAGCTPDTSAGSRINCDIFVEGDSYDKFGPGPAYVLVYHPLSANDTFCYT